MKVKLYLAGMIFLTVSVNCTHKPEGSAVTFPEVSDPVQITSNDKEHLFASYYGINSFSKSQKFVTVLETDVKYRLPTENDKAVLGLVNLHTKEFIPIAETSAWNFQQGCMAHWLATSPDSLIIYNDLREGKFVSVILNVHTKEELKVIPYPVSAVSPNGKEAISINFARLRITRPDYGYGGEGQDPIADVVFPEDDGLFLIDLETGKAKMIVSIAQIKDMVPEVPEGQVEFFNHTLFSRNGSKIMWFARAIGRPFRNTTPFTVNKDGSNLQVCFPEGWFGSHFDWLNDDELMITAKFNAKKMGHVLFNVGKDNYKRLGGELLGEGHGTFSPDGEWMCTDTYPEDGTREQNLYLMDMKSQAILPIGKFYEPEEFSGWWRCDLHCRWSPNGDIIGFNSTHTGSRQAYIIKLTYN